MYYLVLTMATFGALIVCNYSNRDNPAEAKRVKLGLSLLFLIQVFLLIASWAAWLRIIDEHLFIPPLDRIAALFSLVLVIWLWAFAEKNLFVDVLVSLLEILILLVGFISLIWWLRENSGLNFYTSLVGAYAFYSGWAIVAIGLILLLITRSRTWGYGVLMLGIFTAGYLAQFFYSQVASDYSWYVRLGEMIAFSLLLAIPRRLLPEKAIGKPVNEAEQASLNPMDASQVSTIANLVSETSPQRYYQELTQFAARMLDSSICFIMMPPKSGEQIIIPVGYDHIRDRELEGTALDGRKIPSLVTALLDGKSLRLDGVANPEAQTFAGELGLKQPSHLLAVPFSPKGSRVGMGIVALSTPGAPSWTENQENWLKEALETLTNARQPLTLSAQQPERSEAQKELQKAQAYVDQVRLEYAQLKAKYDSLSVGIKEAASPASVLVGEAMGEVDLQQKVAMLESRNQELENLVAKGKPSFEEVEQLRQELRAALVDLARIPSTLSKSDQRMLEQQLSAMKRLDDMHQSELITSIAQEMRQPLSSVIGYTDVLLAESTGILGAVQRRLLERVNASTERMSILLNEIVQVVAIEAGKIDQTAAWLGLKAIIDEAIGSISNQVNEKNIILQVDVPDNLPEIQANKDALLQIISNLLENACLVSPLDSEIKLYARIEQKESEPSFIHISVTDQGGGIAKADVSRVFSRRYKSENPQIPGIGDTGVGLAIVKSLVELQKGRVWVDSDEGTGSTFSIVLPMQDNEIRPNNQVLPTS